MNERAGIGRLISLPSPNHGARRCDQIDMIVLHYTGTPTTEAAVKWLCSEESEVSSHYFVFEDGRIAQMVDEDRRAWHAGQSCWSGEHDTNSRSIGIEIANKGHLDLQEPDSPNQQLPDFPSTQIDAVISLCTDITERHQIPTRNLVAHSDVAPGRKQDPGERFPWHILATAGLGHFVPPEPITPGGVRARGDEGDDITGMQALLALYGYPIPVNGRFCETTEAVVSAFQRHFRQARVDGIADRSTINTLGRLIETLH